MSISENDDEVAGVPRQETVMQSGAEVHGAMAKEFGFSSDEDDQQENQDDEDTIQRVKDQED